MKFILRENKRNKLAAIGIAWLFLLAHAARGQAKTGETPPPIPPQARIRIEAQPKTATIGDPIRLNMEIVVPPGCQAEISKPAATGRDYFIMGFSSGPVAPQAAGKPPSAPPAPAHYRAQITIAVYTVGKFVFPAIPVKIRTADGKEITTASPPVAVEIRSVIAEKNPGLKGLKKQAEIPEPRSWLPWTLAAAFLCALGAIVWYFRRRRRRPAAPSTPIQTRNLLDTAEADLRNLLARGVPDGGMEKQFYVALSEIVKKILEAGYGIHTAEQTTSEIMDSLRRKADMGPENRDQTGSFLTRCDVVKFAKYVPSRAEHEAAAQNALRILAEAKKAAVLSLEAATKNSERASNVED